MGAPAGEHCRRELAHQAVTVVDVHGLGFLVDQQQPVGDRGVVTGRAQLRHDLALPGDVLSPDRDVRVGRPQLFLYRGAVHGADSSIRPQKRRWARSVPKKKTGSGGATAALASEGPVTAPGEKQQRTNVGPSRYEA